MQLAEHLDGLGSTASESFAPSCFRVAANSCTACTGVCAWLV